MKNATYTDAVEPDTVVSIHRHLTKEELFVVLRGKAKGYDL